MFDGIDPRSQAFIAMGSNLMANSGPSLMPQSLGSLVGQAATAGLNQYQSAQQAQLVEMMKRAQVAEIQRKTQEAEENRRIRGVLFPELGLGNPAMTGIPRGVLYQGPQGVLGPAALPQSSYQGLDPERLERMGTYLSLTGNPGAATLINTAERLRTRQEEQQTADSFKSRPGVLGAGVTTNSPQGRALLSNLSGDQEFDSAVLQAQNEALNSNPNLAPQPVQAPKPGLFTPLTSSPYVGSYAEALQGQIDSSRGVKPQQMLQQHNNLLQMHQTATNQAAARNENAQLRRDLAEMNDGTRRMIAGMNHDARRDRQGDIDAQRVFTREQSLARDYNANPMVKDFQIVLPHFTSAAQYVAGQQYDSSGDRALAFQYARTLDPRDRVGVNDIKDINKLGNIPERVQQALVGLAEGKKLPDRVRLDMFNAMRSRFQNMNDLQMQIEDEYEEKAKRNMLKPENVVIRYGQRANTPKKNSGEVGRIRFDANGNERQ